jgi:YidC/Oxa1 family membrane protein insertase
MDKNTVIGIGLMFVFYMGFSMWFAPTEAEITERERIAAEETRLAELEDSTTAFINTEEISAIDTVEVILDSVDVNRISTDLLSKYGKFASTIEGEDNIHKLSSSVLDIEISERGAMPVTAVLTDGNVKYGGKKPRELWEAIELWDPKSSKIELQFEVYGAGLVKTSDLHFNIKAKQDSSISFIAEVGDGSSITITHTLQDYRLSTKVLFKNLEGVVNPAQTLDWSALGFSNEKGIEWERQHTSIFYKNIEDGGRTYLSEGQTKEETLDENKLEWMAFKQDFFSVLVSKDGGFDKGAVLETTLNEADSSHTLHFHAAMPTTANVLGRDMAQEFDFYLGPNKLENLNSTGLADVGKIIDYGWWIFGWVNRNAILPLYNVLHKNIVSAGLIVLLITLIIKMFLFPITWKNFLSSAKMKMLRPDIEEINETHKDDATARQQATMELYRKTGVNPMAGCLPALLQMPILYAMFRFFPANIDLRGQSFLWADDLAAFDAVITWSSDYAIPFYGNHVSGFTVLMAISIFFYMRMTTAGQPPQPTQPGMPNMKVIQNFIPFTMLFFFNKFAAGLSLYYLAANLVSIGQMLIIKRYFIDEVKIRAQIDENARNPKKKSAFQERLAEMQKEQQNKTKDIKSARSKRKK